VVFGEEWEGEFDGDDKDAGKGEGGWEL
jgi:hypothetical protein